MKLLVATPYYHPKLGGLENYARQLNIALKEQLGWDVVVVTSNHEGKDARVDTVDGITVHRLGTMLKFSNTPLNPLWPLQMRRIIKQEKPDLILAHSPVPSMADAAALAHGRTPLIVTYHAATLLKGSLVFDTIVRVYRVYESLTFSQASRILAVSEFVKQGLSKRLQRKTRVLPNAVWERDITSREQPETNELLFIGSLERTHAWKGLDDIIDAVNLYRQQYGDVHLTVMGDGNYRQHYEDKVRELGLEQTVTFAGAQTGDAKEATIRQASLLVTYPTTANDAFPTVLLEAWAREVPTISAAIGPLPSLVNDGQDGFLVAPHDPSALAGKLHEVLSMPAAERAAIAQTAARRTRQHYTWERQAQELAHLSKELTA